MAMIRFHALIRMVMQREKEHGLRYGHKHVDLEVIIGAKRHFVSKPTFLFFFISFSP
jgi:hypothetical protein